jgi:tetratricopeptide (TPR) repeat protein
MLIEEGLIVPGDEQWHIEHHRLATVHVPPTLSGVLQARLDALPLAERMLLQRAATFGRIFWASAVEAMGQDTTDSIQTLLATLRQRELIYRHETSAFEGTTEYMFRHALLREVVYEGTLKRQRHVHHHQAALWLEEHAGARAETYAGLIADHYAHAGDAHRAGTWWLRAARQALSATDPEAAITTAKRACTLLEGHAKTPALLFLGSMFDLVGEWTLADEHYHQVLAWGNTHDTGISSAQASLGLGKVARKRGDYVRAVTWLDQALLTFTAMQDSHGCCQVLIELAWIRRRQGNYAVATQLLEEASHLARAHGLSSELASIYQTLGLLHQEGGRLEDAHEAFTLSFGHAQAAHHAERMGAALVSLGINALHREELGQAQSFLEDAYARYTELASPFGVAIITINLGHVSFRRGALHTAQRYYLDGVDTLCQVGDLGSATVGLIGVAAVLMANTPTEQQAVQATRLLAATTTILAKIARVLDREDQEILDATQQQIITIIPEDRYADAWEHGTQLTMEDAIIEAKAITLHKN